MVSHLALVYPPFAGAPGAPCPFFLLFRLPPLLLLRLTPSSPSVPSCRRYKGKGAKGNGKAGYVYKLGLRNGKANIDEYAPIYVPKDFKTDGDTYEGDLRLVFAAVAGIVVTGAGAILLTSSL